MKTKIISIGYSVPPDRYSQEETFQATGYPEKFKRIFMDSQIDERHFVGPPDKLRKLSFQEQQELYQEWALILSCEALESALDGRDPGELGLLTYSTCTGFAPGPTIPHYVADRFGMPHDIQIDNRTSHGCFPKGHDVFTENGFVDISDVPVGTKVMSDDGKFNTVEKVFIRSYRGNMIKIKSYSLPDIQATPEHPFLIVRPKISGRGEIFRPDTSWAWGIKNWDWKPRWCAAQDLQYGDFLLIPKTVVGNVDKFELSQSFPCSIEGDFIRPFFRGHYSRWVNKLRNNLLQPELLRLFGLYVAEGYTYTKNRSAEISFAFSEDEQSLVDETVSTLKWLGLKPSVRKNKGRSIAIRAFSKPLCMLLNEWFGHRATEKKIPNWIFGISADLKESFISGMMDGDGTIGRNKVRSYSTASKELAEGLCLLLASTGKASHLYTQWNNGYRQDWQYKLNIRDGGNKRLWYDDGRYIWNPVRSTTEEDFDGYVYNLKVSDKSTYTCSLVSVHNCEASFPGMRRAYEYTALTGRPSASIACELCSLTYFPEPDGKPDPTNKFELLRSNAIFADGCSCVILGQDDNPKHPEIVDFTSYLDTRYLGDLGYTWRDGRLRVLLSPHVPDIAAELVEKSTNILLKKNNLVVDDIRYWAIHPPGASVLDKFRDGLGIPEEKMKYSREVLRRFGNCSSSTVGIVGKALITQELNPEGYLMMITVGPGMVANSALLKFG